MTSTSPDNKDEEEKNPDFVLVIKEDNLPRIDLYLKNLKVLGFKFENETGKVYEIGNEEYWIGTHFYNEPIFKTPFENPATDASPLQKGQLTEAEKILVVSKILENTKYGERDQQYGLTKLISLKVIETAYPLHDGPATTDGVNNRSLLYRFWANTAVTHMQQPLDLIFRYFGSEVAFYFAWLEYFNIMLVIPAVLGAIAFLASLLYAAYGNPSEVKELCENTEVLCPICEDKEGCTFKKLNTFCSLAHWSYVFDNNFTISFAVFISFWATLFLMLWRRKESNLKLRWYCDNDIRETEIRQPYLDSAKHVKPNRITGEIEPYIPKRVWIFHYTITFTACVILFGITLAVLIMNMIVTILFLRQCNTSNNEYLVMHAKFLAMTVDAIIRVFCIKVFEKFYGPASVSLTKYENPRTQLDFDNSVLYKRYLLACMNNYIPVLYLAFFKGKFVTVPHEMTLLRKDACQPCNCVLALCLQLTFVLTVKTLMGNICSNIYLQLKKGLRWFRTLFSPTARREEDLKKTLPRWEKEYYLEPMSRYSVNTEFTEMVIRYGYVAFFSKAFPLASLCVLLNNLIELRSDAFKFLKLYRRPIPVQKSGIGAWNGVFRSLSYISSAINAFVIAFTSDWVSKEVYRFNRGGGRIKGYLNKTLSKYAISDYSGYDSIPHENEFCYFRGNYFPPDSEHKYTRNQKYWVDLTFRVVAVFVFEHIILLCGAILTYCIPYQPESVKLFLDLNAQKEKEARLKEYKDKLDKQLKNNMDLSKSLRGIKH